MSLWNSLVNYVAGKSSTKDREALKRGEVASAIDEFNDLFAEDANSRGRDAKKIEERKKSYTTMINHYYDLVTDFYEYGWGASFHFAPRYKAESFDASLARHEHYLASRLGLKPGMRCLDVGSGVGGPMRAIARFSGANVVGANNNEYQIQRSGVLNEREGLAHLCTQKHGDFMHLTDNFARESFDAAYAVEATCHAPDKTACFRQIYETLKPGGAFACYEWCITDRYDPDNAEHRLIKHQIEHGDSLPDLVYPEAVLEAMEAAGFEVVDSFDVAEVAPKNGNEVPWYSTLQGSYKSVANFRHSKLGRFCTQKMVDVLETIKVAPKGTSETHKMLCIAADSLARGGELGIFTPMFFCMGRRPKDSGDEEEEEEEEE